VQTDERAPRSRRRRWIGIVVSVVLIVAVFGFLLPKLADYADVWDVVSGLDSWDIFLLSVVGIWNLFALAPLVMVSQPGTRFMEAFVNMTAGAAVANTVPGGSAIGIGINWAMFDSWGFTPAEYTLATLVSGVWNNFVKLGVPVIALLALAATGDLRGSFVPAAIVGVLVMAAVIVFFALVLRSDELARAIGGWLGRIAEWGARKVHRTVHGDAWGDGAIRFRHRSVGLIKRRWPALTMTALIGQLSLYLVLLVAVRAVGLSNAEVSWAEVLASWAFVRLISAVPITPGGLGVVELGLTAALANGENTALTTKAAAAVLLYRALTYLLPIPVGAGCYIFWRVNHSWRERRVSLPA
jgi:putative heme transporter